MPSLHPDSRGDQREAVAGQRRGRDTLPGEGGHWTQWTETAMEDRARKETAGGSAPWRSRSGRTGLETGRGAR